MICPLRSAGARWSLLRVSDRPDYALDMHTMKGKAMGRGLDHFREEGAKLVPQPTAYDRCEDEAYRQWDDQVAGQVSPAAEGSA